MDYAAASSRCAAAKSRPSSRLVPTGTAVAAARVTGFAHHDLGQQRQARLQPVPQPDGDALAGGVVQALDLVEVVVIEEFVQRLERLLDVGEVEHPAAVGPEGSVYVDLHHERVAVQARALVTGWHVRQAV